jgi:hypothetical protein
MPTSRMGRTVWTLRRGVLVTAILACLLLATVGIGSPAAARRDIVFPLFGSRSGGWGFTNTSLMSPGPRMDVWVGDNVTLNLTSLDGRTHTWFIDYNNNSQRDAVEPRSNPFGPSRTPVLWNFTVSNVTGTFRYRSDRGSDINTMWGNITVSPEGTGSFLDLGVVVVGVIVLAIAVVAIIAFVARRSRSVPPPPPPEG